VYDHPASVITLLPETLGFLAIAIMIVIYDMLKNSVIKGYLSYSMNYDENLDFF
jgi:hypothetical protein